MEMNKLINLLVQANIPFAVLPHWENSLQVWYPNANPNEAVCDVICFPGSYGYEAGLLEMMGLVDKSKVFDDVEGWLTAEEVFSRIQKHYLKNHNKEEL